MPNKPDMSLESQDLQIQEELWGLMSWLDCAGLSQPAVAVALALF